MPTFTLTVLDLLGIQGAIFNSNRLRENLGASQLVESALGERLRAALPRRHNLADDGMIRADVQIEADEQVQAEVILRGGGSALVIFRTPEAAQQTVRALSRDLLLHAPGLTLAVASLPWDSDTPLGGNAGALMRLFAHLDAAKRVRSSGAPLLGQGVALECRSTGMPAVGYAPPQGADDDGTRPVSADILARLDPDVLAAADARFTDLLPEAVRERYRVPDRFDDLGRTAGVQSYTAVVHADGNGIGRRFDALYAASLPNRDLIEALRRLSQAVDNAGKQAIKATINSMAAAFLDPTPRAADDPLVLFLAGLPRSAPGPGGKPYLPFRPLVYGGDDVTFVCDGRLGLPLAELYLRHFHQATIDHKLPQVTIDHKLIDAPAHACAGVAIVKTHYPFARAYELAEALCTNAKDALRTADRINSAAAIDWHFALSGLLADLRTIRLREYRDDNGRSLVQRPLALEAPGLDAPWQTWETFAATLATFRDEPNWRDRRNKVKELYEVLRRGPDAVERFRRAFVIPELPEIPGAGKTMRTHGWADGKCGYFDALEALDFFLKLT